jgi:hypothetical protein
MTTHDWIRSSGFFPAGHPRWTCRRCGLGPYESTSAPRAGVDPAGVPLIRLLRPAPEDSYVILVSPDCDVELARKVLET